ncbi:MAG TPA: dithiol-disulfide isomerase [Mycobacteriales bacterium]|nr:dithiol-disulfide isomerase [Mycobacteriales bacterium]
MTLIVPNGRIVIYSDIGCPWASLAVHRLRARRRALGLEGAVLLDHRAWPLELVNGRCTPKPTIDAEVAVIGSHEPALGWRPWRRPTHTYPATTLLALEAVQAAKIDAVGGLAGSEDLDAALRDAFYVGSEPISIYPAVINVARGCPSVDVAALEDRLQAGAGRPEVFEQWGRAREDGVTGSPHLFLPGGEDVQNPGIKIQWSQETGQGFPRIMADDPSAIDTILRRAAA